MAPVNNSAIHSDLSNNSGVIQFGDTYISLSDFTEYSNLSSIIEEKKVKQKILEERLSSKQIDLLNSPDNENIIELISVYKVQIIEIDEECIKLYKKIESFSDKLIFTLNYILSIKNEVNDIDKIQLLVQKGKIVEAYNLIDSLSVFEKAKSLKELNANTNTQLISFAKALSLQA